MPCCGGKKSVAAHATPYNPPSVLTEKTMQPQVTKPERVKMEFLGRQTGPIPYTVNNHIYYGANTNENRYADVLFNDVQKLLRLGVWRVVPEPPPPPPAPEPVKQAITIVEAPEPVAVVIPVEKKEPVAIAPTVKPEAGVIDKRKRGRPKRG